MVTDEATYIAMARDHFSKDVEVDKDEVRRHQNVLSHCGCALVNVLGYGLSHSYRNYSRCMYNAGNEAEDAPTMKVLPKVHKGPTPSGHPQSHPVVTAASGILSRAGDVISDFLEPLVSLMTPRMEERSTEEVLSQLEEAKVAVESSAANNVMVGSLDVSALYPSLHQEESAELVSRFIEESPVRLEGMDLRSAQVYLASNLTPVQIKLEGLKGLVPARVHKYGKRPGPTSTELGKKFCPPDKTEDPDSRGQDSLWQPTNPDQDLTASEKRRLIAKSVKLAIITVFRNHVYQFGERRYRQVSGGPIGLRLTSLVARIVMDRWALSFLSKLDKAGVTIWAMVKYVDDISIMIAKLEQGTQWVGPRLVKVDSDNSPMISTEQHTMDLVKECADSILQSQQVDFAPI